MPNDALIEPISDGDIQWARNLLKLKELDEPRVEFLKKLTTTDVSACPGSGKTTLIVAKLAILARKWRRPTQGICVLSHTNVAREEIEQKLGNTVVGQTLLSYPHYIDTIHGFINRYLAIPWLYSANWPITAIDNDIASAVRRRGISSSDYNKLSYFLSNKYSSFESLRIGTVSLDVRLDDKVFPAGQHTDMYKLAATAIKHSVQEGHYCHDEMFVFARDLMQKCPDLPKSLSRRFPIVIIDEMQDTSAEQNEFLTGLFSIEDPSICIQRVGDSNQQIFERGAAPESHAFPDDREGCCLSIPSSFRFGPSIASLASPLAVTKVLPAGLCGLREEDAVSAQARNAVFIFPNQDASGVLDAYARHLVSHLPIDVIGKGPIAAVGALHKDAADITPGHTQFPKSVGHYWSAYKPGAGRKMNQPRQLAECFLMHQANALMHDCVDRGVNTFALGLIRLANILGDASALRNRQRYHRAIEERLTELGHDLKPYRSIVVRFLIDREPLTEEGWTTLQPELRQIGAALGGGDPNASPDEPYLAWPSLANGTAHGGSGGAEEWPANTYRFSDGTNTVDIKLGSIHSVKGQNHAATLILETFIHRHCLEGLLPWLLGDKANWSSGQRDREHLLQTYVAMTRPMHALCLAMKSSSFGSGGERAANLAKLQARGWQVIEVGPGGAS